jgi:hypothetical protein
MKKIITKLLAISSLLTLVGCVTISVNKPDGTKYSYRRYLGSQNLEDVSFVTPDGVSFHIGKQNGMNNLDETMKNTSEAGLIIAKRLAGMP